MKRMGHSFLCTLRPVNTSCSSRVLHLHKQEELMAENVFQYTYLSSGLEIPQREQVLIGWLKQGKIHWR